MTVRQVLHRRVTDGASTEAASVQPQMCECLCGHVLLIIVIFAEYVTTARLPRGLDAGGRPASRGSLSTATSKMRLKTNNMEIYKSNF